MWKSVSHQVLQISTIYFSSELSEVEKFLSYGNILKIIVFELLCFVNLSKHKLLYMACLDAWNCTVESIHEESSFAQRTPNTLESHEHSRHLNKPSQ